jgi:16S rRNA (adenine1518-N6/adenine1519-N6)-dimethyltransferase
MDDLSSLFKELSYRPRKSAGQNFLVDTKALDRIETSIDCPPGDVLLEVGGGTGALTERLLRKGRPLTVVEVDHKLSGILERRFAQVPGLNLVKSDILKFDLGTIAPPLPGLITLAGNIPYYLTTSLITGLLEKHRARLRRIYLMVQKEVADRLQARPGTKAYGALTLCVGYHGHFRRLLEVPAKSFKPAPKVDSTFIEIELRREPLLQPDQEKRLFSVIRAIFQTRRKVLANSLKGLGKGQERTLRALERTGLDPQVRGETLGLDRLIELSKALEGD